MERFLKSRFSINKKRESPLRGHLDELAGYFAESGYTRQHVQYQLRLAAEFGVNGVSFRSGRWFKNGLMHSGVIGKD